MKSSGTEPKFRITSVSNDESAAKRCSEELVASCNDVYMILEASE